MILIPIYSKILKSGDMLAPSIAAFLKESDIVAVSSKAIATIDGNLIDLKNVTPSKEAEEWSRKTGRSPAFCEATIQETKRLRGTVRGFCPGALVTEVRPDGMPEGTIITANAGLDESNAGEGFAIGWPLDPVKSAKELKEALGGKVGVLITDSCLRPRRRGVVAFALTVAGFDPFAPQQGKEDLFGKQLRITTEATADQLATAANFLMGNAGQATPACIICDHGIPMTEFAGWVPGIEPDQDLFKELI